MFIRISPVSAFRILAYQLNIVLFTQMKPVHPGMGCRLAYAEHGYDAVFTTDDAVFLFEDVLKIRIIEFSDRQISVKDTIRVTLLLLHLLMLIYGREGNQITVHIQAVAFHEVLELSHISRPAIGEHLLPQKLGKRTNFHIILPGKMLQEKLCKCPDILRPLAQGRNIYGNDIEPVIKVLPECAVLYLFKKISVRGGDQPKIGTDELCSADAHELTLLQYPQKFDLKRDGNITDFIYKKSSVVGEFKKTFFLVIGAGETSLFMPVELTFKKLLRSARNIYSHESTASTTLLMYPPCQHLLADT